MQLLEVSHETRYRYAVPVSPALHLAHLQPLSDDAQALLGFELTVDPAPDELSTETDVWGNTRLSGVGRPCSRTSRTWLNGSASPASSSSVSSTAGLSLQIASTSHPAVRA